MGCSKILWLIIIFPLNWWQFVIFLVVNHGRSPHFWRILMFPKGTPRPTATAPHDPATAAQAGTHPLTSVQSVEPGDWRGWRCKSRNRWPSRCQDLSGKPTLKLKTLMRLSGLGMGSNRLWGLCQTQQPQRCMKQTSCEKKGDTKGVSHTTRSTSYRHIGLFYNRVPHSIAWWNMAKPSYKGSATLSSNGASQVPKPRATNNLSC